MEKKSKKCWAEFTELKQFRGSREQQIMSACEILDAEFPGIYNSSSCQEEFLYCVAAFI